MLIPTLIKLIQTYAVPTIHLTISWGGGFGSPKPYPIYATAGSKNERRYSNIPNN